MLFECHADYTQSGVQYGYLVLDAKTSMVLVNFGCPDLGINFGCQDLKAILKNLYKHPIIFAATS